MPDDLDDLLRRAMATLDRQVPARYFDDLADRALARLDEPDDLDPCDELARERAARDLQARSVEPGEPVRVIALRDEALPGEPIAATALPEPPAAFARSPSARRRRFVVGSVGLALAASAVVFFAATRALESRESARSPAFHDDLLAEPSPAASVKKPARSTAPHQTDRVGLAIELSSARDPQPMELPERPNYFPPPTAEDVRRAMADVAVRAEACFTGARGRGRSLIVTVGTSGKIEQVALEGGATDAAETACLQSAVSSVQFGTWSGSPQVFRYQLTGRRPVNK